MSSENLCKTPVPLRKGLIWKFYDANYCPRFPEVKMGETKQKVIKLPDNSLN